MQDNSYIEAQKALYSEKNEWMDTYYERVDPYEFYREIFPVGSFERKMHYEDAKGNGIAITIRESCGVPRGSEAGSERFEKGIALDFKKNGEVHRYTLTDGLEELRKLVGKDFVVMSPISYFGRSRSGRNARYIYALVFDLDGVGMPQLRDTFHQMNTGFIPAASFVVNSGTGLHLYYQFEEPVPMYPQNQKFMKELKYALTRRIWNNYTSEIKEPQVQGVMQGFRVVGSGTKLGLDYPVVAYRYGKPVSIEYLLSFVPSENGDLQRVLSVFEKSKLSLEEARKKYPEWYERRVIRGEKKGRWTVKPALYHWWLRRIETDIRVGHRFYGIMTLAIYAVKCGISEEVLRRDAFRLLKTFDDMSYEESNRFTEDDVVKALEMYNESFVTFPRDDIAKYSGIPIPANKRNYKTQKQHLEIARAIRDVKVKQKGKESWREGNGRKSKEKIIRAYMAENPDVTNKSEIARALKIHRNTVRKYYDSILDSILDERDKEVSRTVQPSIEMEKLRDMIFGKNR